MQAGLILLAIAVIWWFVGFAAAERLTGGSLIEMIACTWAYAVIPAAAIGLVGLGFIAAAVLRRLL